MYSLTEIGPSIWSREEIQSSIEDFRTVYQERPIKVNSGGMRLPHMFAVWFIVRKLSPSYIVESGVWKGQSTWLLETAAPNAKVISIDLDLSNREYLSKDAEYYDIDFSEMDWTSISDDALVFFDDHQDCYRRLQQAHWFGFKYVIFEDNYPAGRGDCYSLKKAFDGVGFTVPGGQKKKGVVAQNRLIRLLYKALGFSSFSYMPQYRSHSVRPNNVDATFIKKKLASYAEFPPVFMSENTRWGDPWVSDRYPTPAPIYGCRQLSDDDFLTEFYDDACFYTWICLCELK